MLLIFLSKVLNQASDGLPVSHDYFTSPMKSVKLSVFTDFLLRNFVLVLLICLPVSADNTIFKNNVPRHLMTVGRPSKEFSSEF